MIAEPKTLLFDHNDFCIVYKPVGITMHDSEHGILTKLQMEWGKRFYLVHRLDDGTSGCLLLAKNEHAAADLSQLFATRQVQKYYLALIDKKPSKKQGTVAGDMKNRRSGKHILLKTRSNPAVTQFFTQALGSGLRLAIVKPLTGKTHQIRVALKSVGSPIIGDHHYQGSTSDRLYLHAWGLSFTYQSLRYTVYVPPIEGALFSQQSFTNWLAQSEAPSLLPWPSFKLPQPSTELNT